ncbi:MAG TPA: NAD-dependent epimerase/dehydratase family protein [Planctomycetaceae bacterium]|nr:NAD-dependent epimerase/dehydratase family protein [Planctomycetaceae bacterium]HQZ64941.1 NAD-dependent epimerase/dehydratase family protein [Planctomycetaceae bacterium]
MMASQNSVLITGGAGFLGSHLAHSVLEDSRYAGMTLVILDDLSGGFLENVPPSPRIQFVNGSVTDHVLVEQLFQEHSFRFVFHLAAYAAEGLSHFIRRFNYTNNLIGSVNLVNASVRHDVQHFVFTSSIAVYGSGQVPMLESTQPQPEDPYGISKYAVELDLKSAHEQFGLNYTVFRPHNVYGEFQNIGDKYRNVVGIFMNRIMQQQPLPVFGDGTQQRAFSYVGDLMHPMVSAPFTAGASREVFNVGASTPTSVLDLATLVCCEFGVEPSIDFQSARNEVKIAWADHAKCDSVFGYRPATELQEGLHRMANWARETGPRSSMTFENIEITKRLPVGWVEASK